MRYEVRCDIGCLYVTVDADSEDDAMAEAIDRWNDAAGEIIAAGTFQVNERGAP